MVRSTDNPTKEAYAELQKAYDHFNHTLFAEKLPACLITLQRKTRTYGYFSQDRFQHTQKGSLTDEIAMNPDHFKTKPLPEVLSTLVHEMAHLQQAYFGRPSRKGYHNKEWASIMKAIGLIPSDTGEPGGNCVGQHMSHYIESSGTFDQTCKTLLSGGFRLSWADNFNGQKEKPKLGRIKYTCDMCKLNAWAKPLVLLVCGACQQPLLAENDSYADSSFLEDLQQDPN